MPTASPAHTKMSPAQSPAVRPGAATTTRGFSFTANISALVGTTALVFVPILLAFCGEVYLKRTHRPIEALITAEDGSPDIATSLAWSPGPDSRLLVGTQSGKTFTISPDGSVEAKVAVGDDEPVIRIHPTSVLEHYDLVLDRSALRLLTLYETRDRQSQRSSFPTPSRGLFATLWHIGGHNLYFATRVLLPKPAEQAFVAGSINVLAKQEMNRKEAGLVETDPVLDITRLISFRRPRGPTPDRLVVGDASGNVAIVDQDGRSGADSVTFVGRHSPGTRIIALSATTLAELDIPLIASAGADGSIKVWSPQAKSASNSGFGEEALAAFAPRQDWVKSAAVPLQSDVGSASLFASGDLSQFALSTAGTSITVRSTDPAKEAWVSDISASVGALVRFSKDDVIIANRGQAHLYTRLGQLKASFVQSGPISAAAFDNTGLHVAIVADDRIIRIYETVTGQPIKALPAGEALITSMAFDPSGTLVAAGLADGQVEIRNVGDSGSSLPFLAAPGSPISQLAFSTNGKRLLTIDAYGNFRSFSVRSLRPLVFLPNSRNSRAVLSSNGAFVAHWVSIQGAAPEIQIFETDTGTIVSRIRTALDTALAAARVSDDGNTVALTAGGNLEIWRKTAGPGIETALPPVAADGLTLSSLGAPLLVREPSGALHITTWSSEIPYRLRPVPLAVPAIQATLSGNGDEIIAACIDGLIRIIPAESTDPTQTLEISGHGDMVTHIALSPDNKYLASASIDGRVRITDLDWARWLGWLPLSWLPANRPLEPMKPQRLDGQFRPTDNQPPRTIPAGTVRQQPATAN
ncbi:hypothetical protein B5K05_13285 [Rhizobium phaseoli]|uniref:WD40 repeat domain-containing protein n=1 Tax=Rhizobium phaseoli TaxID=396 RepID=UPI000E0DA58D|nr:WD40 repeat domain-containing protein [Rhizobium phaseoli]RDJ10103.1 hypothetical protein B5K04_13260 [Rhizobium phaseoli]RDJ14103.1 hypothetical protein B5K05_13285 [Rhizobium phaseoli]